MQVNTNENTLIAKIVGLVIALVVVGMVLVPFVTEATTTERTFENEGYFYLDKINSTDETEHTIVWDVTDGKILTVDGVDMDITTWGLSNYQLITVFATETDLFRLGVISGSQALAWVQVRGSTIAYAGASTLFSATIGGGNVSVQIDDEASPRSLTYTDAYIISPDKADYVMKKSNESAYLKADSVIYGMGQTQVTGTSGAVFKVEGTIEDVDVTSLVTTTPEITISDIEVSYSAVDGYIGLYAFSKVTFVATAGTDTTNCTYSYVIVPASVTVELFQHASNIEITLYQMIPILVVLGLVVAIVGLFAYNRYGN